MALPGITQARADYRIAQANREHADTVLIALIRELAAFHAANPSMRHLTRIQRDELFYRASELTRYEAEVQRLGDLILFMEET